MSLADHLQTASLLAGSLRPGSGITGSDPSEIIKKRLEQAGFHETDLASEGCDLKSRYALSCLTCLTRLHGVLRDASSSPSNDLGSLDLKTIDTLLQIVISLGIYPSLEPSVGIPLESRSRFPLLLNSEDKENTNENANILYLITKDLTHLACDGSGTFISRDVVSKHLPDLYAALIQLIHSPRSSTMSEHVLSHSAEMLESVFTSADSHHSLEALLMLIRSRPPPWLKTQCTQYLSQILLRANGVQTIFECLLPPNSALGTLDTAQLQHVAQIIGSVPKQSISVEEYFENICPQLLRLMKTSPRASMLFRASTHVIGHVINRRPGIGKKHLLNKLMFPLLQFYETIAPIPTDSPTQLDLNGNCILVDERTLSEAIDNLRHLLVGNDSSPALIDALASVVPPLYYIQDFATQTASSIKQPALDILLVFFRIAQSADAGTALWRTILELPLQETAILARGPEGGVLLTEGHGKRLDVDLDRFIDFLDAIKNDDLVGSFFLRLLEHHGKDHHEGADEAVEKLRTIQLILSIMGRYGEHILKKPAQIVTFSKSMLLSEDEEAVSLGMALLTAILSNDETVIETEINTTLEDILIILQALSAHEKDEISFLARELRVLIVTRNSSLEADDDSENQAKRTSLETLQEAMKELADDLLPVRAHGMHLLRHLVLAKDPVLKERIYETNAIFLDQIKDDDSFIYLNAIKGLASLTDVYPGATLTSIAERYAQDAFNLDYRLRIGEALLQTMQRCGDVFAKYALKILPPIFQVLHSDVPELRSSALSLLACVAETAPLSLLPFIHQLMDYVRNLLLLANTNPEPRRAAAVLLLSLVRALRSGPLFAAIDRTVVRDIATRLDILKDTDTDELTRIHARTALADLDDIVAEHLGM